MGAMKTRQIALTFIVAIFATGIAAAADRVVFVEYFTSAG
jgi:hypothetical protein